MRKIRNGNAFLFTTSTIRTHRLLYKSFRISLLSHYSMKNKFILLALTLFISLVSAEIVFRIIGKYPTYTERTGMGGYVSPFEAGGSSWYRIHPANEKCEYSTKEYTASWLANNEGLNDKMFTTSKAGTRMMILGDSFTEGAGASNDSSYPKQLAKILKDSLAASSEVWNCGVSGSDIFFEYVLFRDKLLKYNPDMTVVTINGTDILETMTRGAFERFNEDGTVHYKEAPWFEPFFAHSSLVRRFVFDVCKYNWLFIKKADEQKVNDAVIQQLFMAMDSFANLCLQKNIKLLFVFHPGQIEVEKRDKYLVEPQITYCRKQGYHYLDVREQFYQMGIDTAHAAMLYWPIDGHFNNRGYNYFARGVWRTVAKELSN